MKYQNPVLRGCHPDPSICRAGDDFYLVNSSFEFFPGVPLFHSRDLVHWQPIGHCLDRAEQLRIPVGSQNNSGLYAPTIRYHDGIFYMVVTNVGSGEGTGNFYVWTRDPAGDWSKPVFLDTPGIDPSFFFDEDGSAWYLGTSEDGIALYPLDLTAGRITGERHILWGGTGGSYPEGPHLYRRNGWYYLLISEGGTERCHMITMARSRQLFGPYEPCPDNPVLTNRSMILGLEAIGHADLVEDQHGNWWAVCLGTRTFGYPPRHNLGRETMLVPVDWSGEWPVFGDHGHALVEFETDLLPAWNPPTAETCFTEDFRDETLNDCWNFLYNPDASLYRYGNGVLVLHGNEHSLREAAVLAWLGCRQEHHQCSTEVTLHFPCQQEDEEAGLTIFMNNRHHYEVALTVRGGQRCLIFRRQIGSLQAVEAALPWSEDTAALRMSADLDNYCFFIRQPDGSWMEVGRGETQYLTTEVGGAFTGNYIALYSCGNGTPCQTEAAFSHFVYDGR